MRFVLFRFFIFLGLAVLAGGLFRVQIQNGEYYRVLGDKNRIRLLPLEAPRGRVLDRRGNLLATNRASFQVVATPEDVRPESLPVLSRILKMPEEKIRERIRAPREYPFAPAVIAEDVDLAVAHHIEEARPELPGVKVQVSGLRFYPHAETASHLIGFIGKLSPEEYARVRERRDRYGLNSLIGRSGIEKIYDERLRGWRGGRQIEVNARGDLVRVLSEKDPEAGEDIVVTLDLEFQSKIMDMIRGKHAAVAILDLKSEELLALASSPAYDPNVFVAPGQDKTRLDLLKDSEFPMLDRSVGAAYPAGSIFKLVTALAGLETGKIKPETRFYCGGSYRLKPRSKPFRCWFEQGHGRINLHEALERSCNVYFYHVARMISPDDLAAVARKLGFGEAMKLETTNISPGLVPDSVWKKEKFREKWYAGETLSFAIGQSYLLVSPVQILRLVAIIANNGDWVEPRLLREGASPPQRRAKPLIRKEHFDVLKRGMLSVVQSDYGTGQLARVDFGKMAAKTGTAQAPPQVAHAWMTGFFPYEDPEIAFVVFVEHGGSGGIAAGKVVKQIIETWRDFRGLPLA